MVRVKGDAATFWPVCVLHVRPRPRTGRSVAGGLLHMSVIGADSWNVFVVSWISFSPDKDQHAEKTPSVKIIM